MYDNNGANVERHSFFSPTEQWKRRCNIIKLFLLENLVFNFFTKNIRFIKHTRVQKIMYATCEKNLFYTQLICFTRA